MDFNKMFGKSLWTLKYTEYSLDFLKVILHITFPPATKQIPKKTVCHLLWLIVWWNKDLESFQGLVKRKIGSNKRFPPLLPDTAIF